MKRQKAAAISDDLKVFIDKRKADTVGVEICPKCGGVIWETGDGRRCGDCFCYS